MNGYPRKACPPPCGKSVVLGRNSKTGKLVEIDTAATVYRLSQQDGHVLADPLGRGHGVDHRASCQAGEAFALVGRARRSKVEKLLSQAAQSIKSVVANREIRERILRQLREIYRLTEPKGDSRARRD